MKRRDLNPGDLFVYVSPTGRNDYSHESPSELLYVFDGILDNRHGAGPSPRTVGQTTRHWLSQKTLDAEVRLKKVITYQEEQTIVQLVTKTAVIDA